jgi:cytochrome c biogenesis protein
MSTDINGVRLQVVDLVGSTGLQIKADPGIPWIYSGFALLMIGVIMSYVSHSQVWLLTVNNQLYLGGRTNRAQLTFERELITMIEQANANPSVSNTQAISPTLDSNSPPPEVAKL